MTDLERHLADFHRLRDENRAVRVNVLLTELQVGLALLNASATSRLAETGDRTRALAREAYDVVARYLADPSLTLSDEERAEIETLYAQLGERLGANG
jgi:hypothetical protein